MNRWVGWMRIAGIVALVSLFALVSAAGAAPLTQAADSLDAADQPLASGGITVQSVNASKDGWIAVHLDEGGSPGVVIGHGPVKAGANANVKVQLERDVPAGGKIWPMLHVDAGSIGVYEFPGPDAPVVVNNNIIMEQITITEAAAPTALPGTGGTDGSAALLAGALAILLAGSLLRFRRRA